MAVALARRGADGDEHRIGARDAFGQIGGEGDAACFHVACDDLGQAGLVDRHDALLQAVDLALMLVDADDVMADFGEAGTGHEPHIAGPNHSNPHRSSALELPL